MIVADYSDLAQKLEQGRIRDVLRTFSSAASRAATRDELSTRQQDLPQAVRAGLTHRKLFARQIA